MFGGNLSKFDEMEDLSYGHCLVCSLDIHRLHIECEQERLTGTTADGLYLRVHTEHCKKSVQFGACMLCRVKGGVRGEAKVTN